MKRVGGRLLIALALGVGAGSCASDGGTGPVAGVLTISLATPNAGADDAILFSVSGPEALTSITAGSGLRVFAQPLTTLTRFAVTGTLTNRAVVTVGVADTRKAAQYIATVQSVAAADFQLRSLTGYSLTVSP
jgi:hypothetical protein